jgi:hypothetical protein
MSLHDFTHGLLICVKIFEKKMMIFYNYNLFYFILIKTQHTLTTLDKMGKCVYDGNHKHLSGKDCDLCSFHCSRTPMVANGVRRHCEHDGHINERHSAKLNEEKKDEGEECDEDDGGCGNKMHVTKPTRRQLRINKSKEKNEKKAQAQFAQAQAQFAQAQAQFAQAQAQFAQANAQ